MSVRPLDSPPHFKQDRVGEVWRVDYGARANDAQSWAAEHTIRPASEDEHRVGLLLIDCQNTFCLPDFELFVAGRSGTGAVDDNVRLCEFIYRYLDRITQLVLTMDTHTAMQIFHPSFWVDASGRHPTGGATRISPQDLETGAWRVNPAVAANVADGDYDYLDRHVRHYVSTLAEGGKYPLQIWPYHSMLGGIGHALVAAVEEAVFFHAMARASQPRIEIKGGNPLTEHYSVLQPEVGRGPDGKRIAGSNEELINFLLGFDALIIAGQAKSHCVAWTVQDLLDVIEKRDPSHVERVYLLEDCASPVVVSADIDFTQQADEAFARFAEAGMHLVRSTEPIDSWLEVEAG